MKMNMELYGQFLLSSQINYTCTYLADHLESLNHDNVNYFLAHAAIRPRNVWKTIRHTFVASSEGYLLFDDTVLSKVHSRKIELVRSQWSGNAHGIIKGIGVVNCVYFNALTNQFWLLDYRIFAPDTDGKTKIDHVLDMLASVKHRGIVYGCVLMDSWYAATTILKYVIGEQKLFYCPLKTNRKVDDSGGQSAYVQLKDLQWSDTELREGKLIKVQKMAADTRFKLFRVVLTTQRTDYIVTNDMTQQSTETAEEQSGIRWHVEQFHREDKQITGIQCCQCRKQRSQRNHIAIAMLVWTRLKTLAYQMKKTVYQLKFGQLDDYLHLQLAHPTLSFA
jgi:hypothetical protein